MTSERHDPGDVVLELISLERWHALQDHLAHALGVGLRTLSLTRQLLVNPSWPPGFQGERALRLLDLGRELDDLFPSAGTLQVPVTITRPLGISFAAVPLHATAEQVVAYLIVGPMVLGRREEPDQFRKRVSTLGLHAESLWPLILTIKLYSFEGIKSMLEFLEQMGSALLELAYQVRTLRAMVSEVPKVDEVVLNCYTERLCQSLLDVAAAAISADGGSVMLFDSARQTLQIKAAQGLSQEIIERTRLQRGQGIAGLAALGHAPIVLDHRTMDERFRAQMRRTDIAASIVAPLMFDVGHEAIGVLSLRTSDPQRGFTQDHVQLLRRLMGLAGVAFSGLQDAFGRRPQSLDP